MGAGAQHFISQRRRWWGRECAVVMAELQRGLLVSTGWGRRRGLQKALIVFLWDSGLSVVLRIEPGAWSMLSTHFTIKPAPQH